MYKITHINGITLASMGGKGEVSANSEPLTISADYATRANTSAAFRTAMVETQTLDILFSNAPPAALDRPSLMATLNPTACDEVTLTGVFPSSAIAYTITGVVTSVRALPASVRVTFIVGDPVWRNGTVVVNGPTSVAPGATGTVAIVNAGQATVAPTVIVKPTAIPAAGYVRNNRRTVTITNNTLATWRNRPTRMTCGDTSLWVAATKATATATNVYIYLDGIEQRAEWIAFNNPFSFAWVVIDHLPPGQSLTYDIVYGGTSTTPLRLFGTLEKPAFDLSWEAATATSGSTTTTVRTGATHETNQWNRGEITMLTGLNAGLTRTTTGTTATTITHTAFPNANANTDRYLLQMSTNERWVYAVRQTERSDADYTSGTTRGATLAGRGLWYITPSQTSPGRAEFDVPGGWSRTTYQPNNDEYAAARWTPVTIGGDPDYFAIVDIDRSWEGGRRPRENKVADAVMLASDIPITEWRFDGAFKNPTSMCQAFYGSRASGGEDWEEVLVVTTASTTLVTTSIPLASRTLVGDQRQLIVALIPTVGDEIGPDWRRDSGTVATSTGGTFTDPTKDWAVNQFAGATVRAIDTGGVTRTRTVASNTPDTITATAVIGTLNDTSEYTVTNKVLTSTLRNNTEMTVSFDTAGLVVGPVSAELVNYALAVTLRLDGGAGATPPYHQAVIGARRAVFLRTTEELRIDAKSRTAGIYLTATGALVSPLADHVDAQYVTNAGAALAMAWLPLNAGAHTLYIPDPLSLTISVSAQHQPGYLA